MDDGNPVAGPSKAVDDDSSKTGAAKESPGTSAQVDSSQGRAPAKAKKKPDKKTTAKKKKLAPAHVSNSDESSGLSNPEGKVDIRQCRLGLIIGHQIGSGSFAKVYKAFSCLRQRDVAVKIFKRSDIPENYFNKFIVREIEVIKELRHRNLCKYIDCQFTTKR